METLGERVKRLRQALGLRPEQLAVAARVSVATIYKLEGNKGGVKSERIIPLAHALGVDPNTLLGYAARNGQESL